MNPVTGSNVCPLQRALRLIGISQPVFLVTVYSEYSKRETVHPVCSSGTSSDLVIRLPSFTRLTTASVEDFDSGGSSDAWGYSGRATSSLDDDIAHSVSPRLFRNSLPGGLRGLFGCQGNGRRRHPTRSWPSNCPSTVAGSYALRTDVLATGVPRATLASLPSRPTASTSCPSFSPFTVLSASLSTL